MSHRDSPTQNETERTSLATRLLTGVAKPKTQPKPPALLDELPLQPRSVTSPINASGVAVKSDELSEAQHALQNGASVEGDDSREPTPLPDLATLTPQSDFSPFMARGVSAAVRSAALKTLFTDPHFNVMDKLDVYVDDYSVFTPMPEGWASELSGVKEAFAGMKEKIVSFPHEVEEAAIKSVSQAELEAALDGEPVNNIANADATDTLQLESAPNDRDDSRQAIATTKPINEDK